MYSLFLNEAKAKEIEVEILNDALEVFGFLAKSVDFKDAVVDIYVDTNVKLFNRLQEILEQLSNKRGAPNQNDLRKTLEYSKMLKPDYQNAVDLLDLIDNGEKFTKAQATNISKGLTKPSNSSIDLYHWDYLRMAVSSSVTTIDEVQKESIIKQSFAIYKEYRSDIDVALAPVTRLSSTDSIAKTDFFSKDMHDAWQTVTETYDDYEKTERYGNIGKDILIGAEIGGLAYIGKAWPPYAIAQFLESGMSLLIDKKLTIDNRQVGKAMLNLFIYCELADGIKEKQAEKVGMPASNEKILELLQKHIASSWTAINAYAERVK